MHTARSLGAAAALLFCARASRAEVWFPDLPAEPLCVAQNGYFDATGASCTTCGDGAAPAPSGAAACACSAGLLDAEACTEEEKLLGGCSRSCTAPCSGAGEVALRDGSGCATCDAASAALGTDPASGIADCICLDPSHARVERDAFGAALPSKSCAACPPGRAVVRARVETAGAAFEADPYACQACPDAAMSWDEDGTACACGAAFAQVGQSSAGRQSCVPLSDYSRAEQLLGVSFSSAALYAATFGGVSGGPDTVTVDSLWLRHLLPRAATLCLLHDGGAEARRACQALANLCVLALYDPAAPACAAYEAAYAARAKGRHGREDWPQDLPWLFYRDAARPEPQKGFGIRRGVAFRGAESLLDLRVFRYALDGAFLGAAPLDTGLYYCGASAPDSAEGGGTSSSTEYLRVGYSVWRRFSCDLRLLRGGAELLELYLVDGDVLYPLPARVGGDDAPLVRRFFLSDALSGVDVSDDAPSALRFAERVSLRVRVRRDDPSRVEAPVLTLEYAAAGAAALSAGERRDVRFAASYAMDDAGVMGTVAGLCIAGGALCGALFLLRLRFFLRRRERFAKDFSAVDLGRMKSAGDAPPRALVVGAAALRCLLSSFVAVFLPLWWAVCAYWFAFFKLQDSVFVMLPLPRGAFEDAHGAVAALLCLAQAYAAWHALLKQCAADVLLVDWEDNAPRGGWRDLFVASKVDKVATQRLCSTPLSLLLVLCAQVAGGLRYRAAWRPDVDDLRPAPQSPLLAFCATLFLFAAFSAAQALLLRARDLFTGGDAAERLLDALTVAKTGLLVWDETFRAFYLHGDSPHGSCEAPLHELQRSLREEAMGLMASASLPSCPPAARAFELHATPALRRRVAKLLRDVHALSSGAAAPPLSPRGAHPMARRRRRGAPATGLPRLAAELCLSTSWLRREDAVPEGAAEARRRASAFLRAFFDLRFEREDLTWRCVAPQRSLGACGDAPYHEPREGDPPPGHPERPLGQWAYAAGAPAAVRPGKHSVLVVDERRRWLGALSLAGIEGELLAAEALVLAAVELWSGDLVVAATVAYLLNRAFAHVRGKAGRRNVAAKTAIDELFLEL